MADAKDITYGSTTVAAALDEIRVKIGLQPAPAPPPAPVPVPTPVPATGKLIPLSFFGMHPINAPWPTTYKVGALAKPANVKWAAIETSAGVYNWTQYLDRAVDSAQAHGVDMIYNACGNPGSVPAFYADPAGNWPADFAKLTNYLRAVQARYAARNPSVTIYYEIFNEAYSYNVTAEKLVQYCHAVAAAVPINRVIGPDLNGRGPWPDMADKYFTLGGRKDVRALTVHGYSAFAYTAGANVPEATAEWDFPVAGQGILAGLVPILTKHGLLDKPLWDTEGSWGPNYTHVGKMLNEDIEAAYVARWLLAHMTKFERTYWYGHSAEGQRWGTLQNRKGEVAFKQVQDWTTGARQINYVKAGSVRRMTFERDGGYRALAVWDCGTDGYNGSSQFTVPAGMTNARDLDGISRVTPGGTVVQIGMKPVWLESKKL